MPKAPIIDLDELKAEVKQDKKELKQMHKLAKEPKTYTRTQILKSITVIIVLLSIGAFAGITIERSITSTINSQVQTEVKAQVKSFLAEEK